MNLFEYLSLGIKHRMDPIYVKYLLNRQVLDIGCGRGDFLARNPISTVGIDIDQRLIDQCLMRGLSAYRMSALKLDFPNDTFEAVHAAQIIEHFNPEDAACFIAEASRVLCPGGIIYITTPGVRNVWNTFSHIRPYPPSAIQKLLLSETEGYIREGRHNLKIEYVQGCRVYLRKRTAMFAASILDFLFPPRDPIGWTIVLRKE